MHENELPPVRADAGLAAVVRFLVLSAVVVLLAGSARIGWAILAALAGGAGVGVILFVWHRHHAPSGRPGRLFNR